MGLLNRIFKVGEAAAHKAVDKLEKPELMLEQAIRDQEKNIREAKERVSSIIATERQSKALLDKEQDQKLLWEDKAKAALKAGKEELATKALIRSEEHGSRTLELQPAWETQRKEAEILKMEIHKLEDEMAELKRNKDIIIAQSKAAAVKKEIYQAKAQMGSHNTGDLIARMKEKAQRQAFEASAAQEMAGEFSSSGGDSLEKEFAQLDSGSASSSVKSRLEELKKNL